MNKWMAVYAVLTARYFHSEIKHWTKPNQTKPNQTKPTLQAIIHITDAETILSKDTEDCGWIIRVSVSYSGKTDFK